MFVSIHLTRYYLINQSIPWIKPLVVNSESPIITPLCHLTRFEITTSCSQPLLTVCCVSVNLCHPESHLVKLSLCLVIVCLSVLSLAVCLPHVWQCLCKSVVRL